ncbi:MAG: co-chaperone GroES [Patescibacteria group bacterium]
MNEIKIKLLGDKILVRPNSKTVTKAGIIIPEASQVITNGEILAVGNSLMDAFKELVVGDFIEFYDTVAQSKFNWIKWDKEALLLIRSGDVIGIIPGLPDISTLIIN